MREVAPGSVEDYSRWRVAGFNALVTLVSWHFVVLQSKVLDPNYRMAGTGSQDREPRPGASKGTRPSGALGSRTLS